MTKPVCGEQIADYLIWARDRFGTIEMRGIRREGQQVVQLELETVYVPLAATWPSGAHADIALSDVLSQGDRLIVTGMAGLGQVDRDAARGMDVGHRHRQR
ncbi:MAG: hypothetical protein R2854_18945 [Caldilineaceae bacterium]